MRGIVHRDVKPDNILLERGANRALMTDFGIAGAVRADTPADASYIRGTAHFLSPEQAMGEPTDGRSDIYSLGVVGYHALTGRLPFDGATTTQVMAAHIAGRAKPMQAFSPAVPRKLATAVERCLEKDRDRRWPTGEAFAEAVDAAFEQPREIPAPLRVWLSKGTPPTARVAGTLFAVGVPFIIVLPHHPVAATIGGAVGVIAINLLPEIVRLRQLLRHGFTLVDLRGALRTHFAQRREEIALDLAFAPISERTLRVLAFAGLGTSALATPVLINHIVVSSAASAMLIFANVISGVVGAACAVGALLSKPRSRWLRQFWAEPTGFLGWKVGRTSREVCGNRAQTRRAAAVIARTAH